MPGNKGSTPNDLQFEQAEPAQAGASERPVCAGCKLEIGDAYYVINGHITCPRCKDSVEAASESGSGFGRFFRATLYGSLAALVGAGIWYAVYKITDMQLGLIAIVIGFMVGVAVKKGSNGRGGWLYQGLAMFLTYSAIVVTYIPLIIEAVNERPAQTQGAPATAPEQEPPVSSADTKTLAAEEKKLDAGTAVFALLALFAFALIIPFMSGFQNIMGLIIIGIGLYEAWKINRHRALQISGPFQINAGSAPSIG